jgi:hypothetical protein
VAGADGVDSPGIAGRPGIDEAGAAGAAGAAAGCVRPWMSPGMPDAGAGEDAGAAGVAGDANPGRNGLAPVAAGAVGVVGDVRPGIDGRAAGDDAVAGALAAGTPGKLMPGVAGAAGGVAPSAVARFCRICGALATELISCCGMFGTAGAGTGSAWAIPPVNSAADEPTNTAVARK